MSELLLTFAGNENGHACPNPRGCAMNMQQVRDIARERGVKSSNLKKVELVQAIQTAEGNEPCYGTGRFASCSQSTCLWKDDCK